MALFVSDDCAPVNDDLVFLSWVLFLFPLPTLGSSSFSKAFLWWLGGGVALGGVCVCSPLDALFSFLRSLPGASLKDLTWWNVPIMVEALGLRFLPLLLSLLFFSSPLGALRFLIAVSSKPGCPIWVPLLSG